MCQNLAFIFRGALGGLEVFTHLSLLAWSTAESINTFREMRLIKQ